MEHKLHKKLLAKIVIYITCFMMLFTSAVTVMGAEADASAEPNAAAAPNAVTAYTIQQNDTKYLYVDYSKELSSCVVEDESIVRIDNLDYTQDKVKIRGLRAGTTTVTVYDKRGGCDVYEITVLSCFSSLEDSYTLSIGEGITVSADENVDSYTWVSADSSIATAAAYSGSNSYKASIKGVSEGTTFVTVTSDTGETKQVKIIVKKLTLKVFDSAGKRLESMSIKKGNNKTVYLSYGNVSLSDCTAKISDPSVVSVTDDGTYSNKGRVKISALKPGKATVTITNQYGEYDSFEVKVYEVLSDIYFKQEKYTVYLGQQVKLEAVMNPSNHNNTLVWYYDEEVLDVSEDGVVTPKKVGYHSVALFGKESYADHYSSAGRGTCYVSVVEPYFDKESMSLYKGKSDKFNLTGGRSDTKWTSSNTSVATVDNKGNVTAVSAGYATITANTGGYLVKATVTVENPYISDTALSMYRKEKATLKVTGASGDVSWTSSNKKVATVSSSGVVTGKGVGTATITAKVAGEALKCKVTIKGAKLAVTSKTMYTNTSYTLKMYGATNKIKWKSSNSKVAKVSSKGKITAVKKGSATIYAKTDGKTYKCKVKVYNNQKSYRVNRDVSDYDYGPPEVVLSKAYYSKGKLKVDLYVMNNRMFKATKFSYIKYKLYNSEGKLIASQKFKNVKLNIKPYSYKKITLTFSKKYIKRTNVVLNKGVSDDWDYYYKYVY